MNIILSAVVHLGGLLTTFFTLCILCDEHLIPAVEVFIVQFQVPEEVAGEYLSLPFLSVSVSSSALSPAPSFYFCLTKTDVFFAAVTLVAFGSAAPELFLNSVSAVAHTSDLSLSAILGSGMIAFGLIPALCMLGSERYEMKLHTSPILREVCDIFRSDTHLRNSLSFSLAHSVGSISSVS
jgi:Ca2+/Na+ antiporter